MTARQDSDELAWDQSDKLWEEALKQVRSTTTCRQIEAFAEKLFAKPVTLVTPLIVGGFNVLYPIRVEGVTTRYLVRLPSPYQAVFPEEKTLAEAATAACISQRTSLPVPELFKHGIDPNIGPYLVMEDLGIRRGMGQVLEAPRDDPDDTPILWPDICETELKSLYGRLAKCVLQLAQPIFPRIGSLAEATPGSYDVLERPFTLNMSNMVQQSNIPTSIFPPKGKTYQTAAEWYTVLAEMQIATLLFQHNDMVSSEDDCKTKYVSRQLFRRLAKTGRLSTFGFVDDDWSAGRKDAGATLPAPPAQGPFRIWSDDFRPTNVLVDEENRLLGAIDWEFAYVGPAQFTLDPPWWLLLDVPETGDDGIDDRADKYEKRLQTWLAAIEGEEQHLETGALLLSAYMRESWATGRFWMNYAARKSWAFDTIYWKYLDERFFGERVDLPQEGLWKTRVQLLTGEERAGMHPLVDIKMEESRNRVLVDWDPEEARKRLSRFLFD